MRMQWYLIQVLAMVVRVILSSGADLNEAVRMAREMLFEAINKALLTACDLTQVRAY